PTPPTTLPDLLTTTAHNHPHHTALTHNNHHLTYQQLDQHSNHLARQLLHHHIGPEDVVAIAIPRSPETILAIWAITKTGAAFLPIDPTHPTQRITHITTNSHTTLGITTT
ncbi:AMP-binding protein, partial [Nocardia araoensis]|uniref:AMP-binding protein n=1 Tax=Nocardia araoensis TaxID=228600 RepID=UPI00058550B0